MFTAMVFENGAWRQLGQYRTYQQARKVVLAADAVIARILDPDGNIAKPSANP